MVDTDDVQGYQQKFESQRELLADCDLDEADREAIRQFVAHQRANTDNNLGTIADHCNQLRVASERADRPLTDLSKADVDVFLTETLEDEHGLAAGTIRNYRKSLRLFYDWRGADWADEITIGSSPDRQKDPENALTDEEVQDLLQAAKNSRDRAMIALLDDTGLRIGAVLSFQLKHLDLEDRRATVTINENANVKGDSGTKPLTWSREYVANWLADHPRPDTPEAALLHALDNWSEDEDGALRQQYAGQRISMTAEAAGLDPDRVEARLFRDSAITRWILDDLNEQAIRKRVGWDEDSDMFGVYSRVTDEQMNDVIFDHYDIDADEEAVEQRGGLDECPGCKAALRGHEEFCPACGHGLVSGAAEAVESANEAVDSDFIELDDVSEREAAAILRQDLASNPDAYADLLLGGLFDDAHDDSPPSK